jgi:signal transduction histidine kinase
LKPLLERLVRVMEKLNPETHISVAVAGDPVFAGEAGDFEEIAGNLLENAFKWSRGRVHVSLGRSSDPGQPKRVDLVIEDDGPGIPADRASEALQRGRRLDENKPGSGLGLAIVSDLVAEYGGALELGNSELGGLRAVVTLPTT